MQYSLRASIGICALAFLALGINTGFAATLEDRPALPAYHDAPTALQPLPPIIEAPHQPAIRQDLVQKHLAKQNLAEQNLDEQKLAMNLTLGTVDPIITGPVPSSKPDK